MLLKHRPGESSEKAAREEAAVCRQKLPASISIIDATLLAIDRGQPILLGGAEQDFRVPVQRASIYVDLGNGMIPRISIPLSSAVAMESDSGRTITDCLLEQRSQLVLDLHNVERLSCALLNETATPSTAIPSSPPITSLGNTAIVTKNNEVYALEVKAWYRKELQNGRSPHLVLINSLDEVEAGKKLLVSLLPFMMKQDNFFLQLHQHSVTTNRLMQTVYNLGGIAIFRPFADAFLEAFPDDRAAIHAAVHARLECQEDYGGALELALRNVKNEKEREYEKVHLETLASVYDALGERVLAEETRTYNNAVPKVHRHLFKIKLTSLLLEEWFVKATHDNRNTTVQSFMDEVVTPRLAEIMPDDMESLSKANISAMVHDVLVGGLSAAEAWLNEDECLKDVPSFYRAMASQRFSEDIALEKSRLESLKLAWPANGLPKSSIAQSRT